MAEDSSRRKTLDCGTVVPGCNFVAHGDSEADLMLVIAQHAKAVHGVERLSNDLKTKMRASIRDA
jgi:predicted small metal-binding protein